MNRNYGTTSAFTSCKFRRDYSYLTNHECLNCLFCYNKDEKKKVRYRQAGLLLLEEQANPKMFDAPITISKYCEPLMNDIVTLHSLNAMGFILEEGGQVIFRTSQYYTARTNKKLMGFLNDYPGQIQLQLRLMSSSSKSGINLKDTVAPLFGNTNSMAQLINVTMNLNVDTVIYFDPLIYGINDADIKNVLNFMDNSNVRKMIIRQLFSTNYFKEYIATNISKRYANELSVPVGKYWTYPIKTMLVMLEDIMSYAERFNISISLCDNPIIQSLLSHNNCCQFENPNAIHCNSKTTNPNLIRLNNV